MTQHEARAGDKTMHGEAECPALVGGEDVRAIVEECGIVLSDLAQNQWPMLERSDRKRVNRLHALFAKIDAALSLPAQDGDAGGVEAVIAEVLWAERIAPRHQIERAAKLIADRLAPPPPVDIAAEYRAIEGLPTPNAIRGDKGAEAVQAEVVGKVRQRRGVHGDFDGFDVDWLLEGGIHAVGLDGDTYLYVLDIPVPEDGHIELFAPTQAAAKEESDA